MENEKSSEEGRTPERESGKQNRAIERQNWRKIKRIRIMKRNRREKKKSCSIQQWMTRHANVIDN
jgi:hypothetical protein